MGDGKILSVNVGQRRRVGFGTSGIAKRPVAGSVAVAVPGAGRSGLAGDFIGDARDHGGADRAVYAHAREDLDRWESTSGRRSPTGGSART
ncbi:hypothetical protein GCM10022243_44060 [Saccharothrix violaceirubra]|uniref:MOSC domain-containing protein YiiM n=1 Tax=Saccharothrix violaceirubra TaxID=413306 RepID=A0A7W7T445_9PSEU|nr:hypothetical protein [Saccharothrix violaceirubra]MBB4965697.1 MOSC domain-containing protein YiiM [Saccharothrix violaceirubra]